LVKFHNLPRQLLHTHRTNQVCETFPSSVSDVMCWKQSSWCEYSHDTV